MKEATGLVRLTIELIAVHVRATRTSRGHRAGPQILEVLRSFAGVREEIVYVDCVIIGHGCSHHVDDKESFAAGVRLSLGPKRSRNVAPYHDVGATPSGDGK